MIKLQSVNVENHVMWVREKSVTAISRSPQCTGDVYWNIRGSGWSIMVADLPPELRWMVS